MKRSEAVDHLYHFMCGYTHDTLDDKLISGLANAILEEVEYLGMMPPGYILESGNISYKWEPEDDSN